MRYGELVDIGRHIVEQIASNYRRGGRDGTPIFVCFGAPMDLGDLLAGRPRPAQYKRVIDRVMDAIRALGQRERMLREEFLRNR